MEGGVLRGEKSDSEPKNFHLSEQAGERSGNSESNSERVASLSQLQRGSDPLGCCWRGKNPQLTKTQRGSQMCAQIRSWTEDRTT